MAVAGAENQETGPGNPQLLLQARQEGEDDMEGVDPLCIFCRIATFSTLGDLMVHESICGDGNMTVPCVAGTTIPLAIPFDSNTTVACFAGTTIPFPL